MLVSIGDVVDGVLVSAIAVAGRRISVAVDGLRGRRLADDLNAARWFETYRLTAQTPLLPSLPRALTDRLTSTASSSHPISIVAAVSPSELSTFLPALRKTLLPGELPFCHQPGTRPLPCTS